MLNPDSMTFTPQELMADRDIDYIKIDNLNEVLEAEWDQKNDKS